MAAERPLRLSRSARPALIALADGHRMGVVYVAGNGRLEFVYDEAWTSRSDAWPLSLSMPLAKRQHGDGSIRPWLWGLMPDDPDVLDAWGKRFSVSRADVVALLQHVGEECAGAVQFVAPAHEDRVRSTGVADRSTTAHDAPPVHWLTEAELAERLHQLRRDAAVGRLPSDTGQFSLAGAQPKTALYQTSDGRWGVPIGRWPTNRILKPPVLALQHLAWNEHLCLEVIRRLGWPVARSRVEQFAGTHGVEQTIVVERYDRVVYRDRLVRVHQEDVCQALRVAPTRKYESQGGPTAVQTVSTIANASGNPAVDRGRFLDAMVLNWLIAGTDAHAKNFSLMISSGGQVRLAPLYDVISLLPYPDQLHRDSSLAMSIGGERRLSQIGATHWERFGTDAGVGARVMVERAADIAEQTVQVVRTMREECAELPMVDTLMSAIEAHALACRDRLTQ